jgi:hypothetical protein
VEVVVVVVVEVVVDVVVVAAVVVVATCVCAAPSEWWSFPGDPPHAASRTNGTTAPAASTFALCTPFNTSTHQAEAHASRLIPAVILVKRWSHSGVEKARPVHPDG